MKHISVKILFITCLIGFGLISCGGGSGESGGSGEDNSDGEIVNGGTSGTKQKSDKCSTAGYKAVHDAATLRAMSMTDNYCLIADITLTGADKATGFPLGWKSNTDITTFTGNFDGQDNTITGLTVDKNTGKYIGLFAKISSTGTETNTIKNLVLVDFKIKGRAYVGALAGHASGKINITNVTVTNVVNETIISEPSYVGGLIGEILATSISITGNSVTGTIKSAGKYAGGLVGKATNVLISNSYSSVNVTGGAHTGTDYFGGLVGSVDNSAITDKPSIKGSYATGGVSGHGIIGGLVGSLKGNIVDSYAAGAVTATIGEAGGLIGLMEGGSVKNTYATGKVGEATKGGLIGKLDDSTDKCNNACTVTNSYFDNIATTATNAIGTGGDIINTALHAGVNGKAGIKQDFVTPTTYRTGLYTKDIIFNGWAYADWKFAEDNWPILKWQPETLGTGASNSGTPSTAPTCGISGYTAVHDVAGLKNIANNMEGNYCLTADITLSAVKSSTGAYDFKTNGFPLGWSSNDNTIVIFTGNFDGKGKTITGFRDISYGKRNIGLFSQIGSTGIKTNTIKDLKLVNFNIVGWAYVGALAGHASGNINITNVTVTNVANETKISDLSHVGGLIGEILATSISITGSSVTGSISAAGPYAGGLVGKATNVLISNSYSSATVSSSTSNPNSKYIGGLVGSVDNSVITDKPSIERSHATGGVSGHGIIGGLVGELKGKIVDSYATGKVTAIAGEAGGLIGQMDSGSLKNTYATGVVTGPTKGGLVGSSHPRDASVCSLTNSYFDKSGTNSAINDIGAGVGTKTGLVGVAGADDIVKAADGSSNLKSTTATKIFVDWNKDADIWQFATGSWPTFKP